MRLGKIDKQNFFQNSQNQRTTVELGIVFPTMDNIHDVFAVLL